jgi:tetratricopeptide (TPR) repeat protein
MRGRQKMRKHIELLAIFIIILSVLTACSKSAPSLTAAELLDLGEKYLLELNYEQAIVHFIELIQIDPKNPRGYLGAAEAYLGLGDTDKAIDILRQGLKQLPDNSDIEAMLQKLLQSNEVEEIVTSTEVVEEEESEDPPAPSIEPIPEDLRPIILEISNAFASQDIELVWQLAGNETLLSYMQSMEKDNYSIKSNDVLLTYIPRLSDKHCLIEYFGDIINGNGVWYEFNPIESEYNEPTLHGYSLSTVSVLDYCLTGTFDRKWWLLSGALFQHWFGNIVNGLFEGDVSNNEIYPDGRTDNLVAHYEHGADEITTNAPYTTDFNDKFRSRIEKPNQ